MGKKEMCPPSGVTNLALNPASGACVWNHGMFISASHRPAGSPPDKNRTCAGTTQSSTSTSSTETCGGTVGGSTTGGTSTQTTTLTLPSGSTPVSTTSVSGGHIYTYRSALGYLHLAVVNGHGATLQTGSPTVAGLAERQLVHRASSGPLVLGVSSRATHASSGPRVLGVSTRKPHSLGILGLPRTGLGGVPLPVLPLMPILIALAMILIGGGAYNLARR